MTVGATANRKTLTVTASSVQLLSNSPPPAPETLITDQWQSFDWNDRAVVVAVSGGADSVALLRLFTALEKDRPRQIIVAHFNHQLRDDAEQDAHLSPVSQSSSDCPLRSARPMFGTSAARVTAWKPPPAIRDIVSSRRSPTTIGLISWRRHIPPTTRPRPSCIASSAGPASADCVACGEWRLLNGRQDIAAGATAVASASRGARAVPGRNRPIISRRPQQPQHAVHAKSNPAPAVAALGGGVQPGGRRGDLEAGGDRRRRSRESSTRWSMSPKKQSRVSIPTARRQRSIAACCRGLNHHLIRELFVWLWREMGWPQQQWVWRSGMRWRWMPAPNRRPTETRRENRERQSPTTSRMYPGKILARRAGDEFTLVRST